MNQPDNNNRLARFSVPLWLAKRSGGPTRYSYLRGFDVPARVFEILGAFRHTLAQWQFIGRATGKGNKAQRRADEIHRKNGPYITI